MRLFSIFILFILFACQTSAPVEKPIEASSSNKKNSNAYSWKSAAFESKKATYPKITKVRKNINVESAVIEFKFSEDMQRVSVDSIVIESVPRLPCIWYWTDVRHLICEVDEGIDFKPATTYKISIRDGLYSKQGKKLPPFEYKFESQRPIVEYFNIEWTKPTSPEIHVNFNYSIEPESIKNRLYLKDFKGNIVQLDAFLDQNTDDDFEQSPWNKNSRWILKPNTALKPNTQYHLFQKKGIATPYGQLKSLNKQISNKYRKIKTFGKFKFEGYKCYRESPCLPRNSLNLMFSAPINEVEVQKCEAELDTLGFKLIIDHRSSRYISVLPHFSNKTKKLECLESIKDIFGRSLDENAKIEVVIGDYNPFHSTSYTDQVITKEDTLRLLHQSVNHDWLLVNIAEANYSEVNKDKAYKNRIIEVDSPVNTLADTNLLPIELENASNISGVVSVNDNRWFDKKFYVQKTNYNAIVQRTKNQLLVFISDIRTNTPVSFTDFEVRFAYQDSQQRKASEQSKGKTDKNGIAILNNFVPEFHYYNNPSLIFTLANGEQFSIRYNHIVYPKISSEDEYIDRQDGSEVFWGITNKPIYRPGETVKYTGYVRKINGAQLELTDLPKKPIIYVYGEDSDCWSIENCDSFYINKNISQDSFGKISGEFKLPSSVADGRYVISLDSTDFHDEYVNQLVFDIANFKAQKLKVSVVPNVRGVLTEEQFTTTTKAEYYSGGPYSNAEAELSLSLIEGDFNKMFSDHKAFHFTPNNSYDSIEDQETYYFSGGDLDENGLALSEITVPPSKVNFGEIEVNSSVVTDEGEKVFSRKVNIPFSRQQHYVGIQKLDWWLAANQETTLITRVVNLEGKVKDDVKITYYSQKIDSFWRDEDNKQPEEKVKLTCIQAPTIMSNRSQCKFKHQVGYYQLIAEISYPDGSSQHATTSHYFYDTNDSKTGVLVIQSDNKNLKVGDKANLTLMHGLQEASALIIIHREETLDYWWQPLVSGVNKITFDVKESYAPGFDFTIFVNYGDLAALKNTEKPNYAQVATQRFTVESPPERKIVKMALIKDSYGPGETLSIKLNNLVAEKANVVLAVIDESIVDQMEDSGYYKLGQSDLGAGKLTWVSPDFFEISKSLYSSLYQEVSFEEEVEKIEVTVSRIKRSDLMMATDSSNAVSFDALTLVSERSQKSDDKKSANGYAIRQLFKDAAYWNDNITIDKNGSKTVEIKLPDNLTQWKIIAISTTRSGDVFVDDSSIKASKEIEVHSELPGQLTEGDKFTFQAEAVAKSSAIKKISMTSLARLSPSDILINEGSRSFKQVAINERYKLKMEVAAIAEGSVSILTFADAGIENDAILQTSQVHSKNITRKKSYFSQLPENNKVLIDTPTNAISKDALIRFTLSGSLMSNLQGTFDYMKSYPHQCWEQKLSRAIVASINLENGIGSESDKAHLNSQINDAVASIAQFQAPNGGMAFFGNSDLYVSSFLSAFTYKGLQYLEQKGISFPALNINKLERFILDRLKQKKNNLTLEMAAVMINALSSNENNRERVKAYLPMLIQSEHVLDVFSKSQILEVLEYYSEYEQEKERFKIAILDDSRVTNKKRLLISKGNLPWYLYSFGAKNYCSTISSLIATKTDKKTVNQFINAVLDLRRKNKGDFGNTLSNAYCSIAISDYAKTYESTKGIGKYKLSIQQDEIHVNESTKTGESHVSFDLPLVVNINEEKAGTAYLQSTLEYDVDGMEAPAVADGFALTRTYYQYKDRNWVEVNNNHLQQGEFIKVQLKINNPLFRRFVAVTDTLPGTFFALDENLATSAPAEMFSQLKREYYFREKQYSVRNAKFYADILPPGKHVIEYLVKVTHKGEFSALPAKIEEMYDDDVFATSSSQVIKVTLIDADERIEPWVVGANLINNPVRK